MRKINFIKPNAVATEIFKDGTGRRMVRIENKDGSIGFICEGCQFCIGQTNSLANELDAIKAAFEKHDCAEHKL